jgi:hypothetical protein
MTPTAWAQVRAVVIAIVLVGHGIYALPLPAPVTSKQLATTDAERDLAVWRHGLAVVGIEVEDDQLRRFAIQGSAGLSRLHKVLKAPFKPAFDLVGANQAWALFASATTRPERLVVEIQRGSSTTWEPILRRLDPCCTWRESALEYRRIRGVWDGQDDDEQRPGYKGLTRWIARRAFEDYPDAQRVRVRLEQAISRYPWEEPDPTLKSLHERVHRRDFADPKDGTP